MDKRQEELLARLRETFRGEAREHLEAITAGLLALERAGDAERAAVVERILRETHSLKGAARSVSLADAEALCQELESLFAAMKREELTPSAEVLDAIHLALSVLATSCGNPGVAPSAGDREKGRRAFAALRGVLRGAVSSGPEPSGTPEPPQPVVRSAPAAPSPPGARGPAAWAVGVTAAPDTVRVSVPKLAAILQEAEELVGARIAAAGRVAELRALSARLARWVQQQDRRASRRRRTAATSATDEIVDSELLFARTLDDSLRKVAAAAHLDAHALSAVAERLLEDARKVLLLPCSYLLGSLPGILRELAQEQGKEAGLRVEGEDIEIDRRVLDELRDPLLHLLRNSVDHGVERPAARLALGKPARGSVTIAARPLHGSRVELTVADDGCGIAVDKVGKAAVRLGLVAADEVARLSEAEVTGFIFRSGLSTSPILTDLSGRGLGLAIVREKVEKLGGTVTVSTAPGAGTAFRLVVPLSRTTFRGVTVDVAGRRFVFPTANVERVVRVRPEEIRTVENRWTLELGERAVSLVRLRDVLGLPGAADRADGSPRPAVVARAADRRVAFLVDEVLGEQEVMVKPLGRRLARVRNVASASISASGTVIPILDVLELVESAGSVGAPAPIVPAGDARTERRRRLLVAEDSITARALVKSILEGAGYEVLAAVDGMDALTRLKTEPFDLLVSDVDMPRMNGFELTERIRADKKLGELPVVLVTALGSREDREHGIEVGANAYIVKSDFDQGSLLEIVRRLL